jgi:hypothetical protein
MNHNCTNITSLPDGRRVHQARRGEAKNFLARLRIPICAYKENIRTEDNVHTEHTNEDQGPGEEIFNFAWPAIMLSSRKRSDDFDYTDPGN